MSVHSKGAEKGRGYMVSRILLNYPKGLADQNLYPVLVWAGWPADPVSQPPTARPPAQLARKIDKS